MTYCEQCGRSVKRQGQLCELCRIEPAQNGGPQATEATHNNATQNRGHAPGQGGHLPYSNGRHIRYGALWAFTSLLITIGGISSLAGSAWAGLILLIIAAICARYDYQIWKFRAKRLWFIFII